MGERNPNEVRRTHGSNKDRTVDKKLRGNGATFSILGWEMGKPIPPRTPRSQKVFRHSMSSMQEGLCSSSTGVRAMLSADGRIGGNKRTGNVGRLHHHPFLLYRPGNRRHTACSLWIWLDTARWL